MNKGRLPKQSEDFPAWYVEGTKDTWMIFVHGHGTDRSEGLRILPTIVEQGLPSLVMTYRNDAEALRLEDVRALLALRGHLAGHRLDEVVRRLDVLDLVLEPALHRDRLRQARARDAHRVHGLVMATRHAAMELVVMAALRTLHEQGTLDKRFVDSLRTIDEASLPPHFSEANRKEFVEMVEHFRKATVGEKPPPPRPIFSVIDGGKNDGTA
jgi:hypothetical protein